MTRRRIGLSAAALLALALAGWGAAREGRTALAYAALTLLVLLLLGWAAFSPGRARALRAAAAALALAAYVYFSLWQLHPALLPQRSVYDLVANRSVTERLVDPALMKVETWEIAGVERQVLFVHPAASGSTTLVYPVKVQPRTTFSGWLALAPQAWAGDGDGVTFSVFVEDEAGYHLLFSQYVDPKHQQQDQRWIPLRVDLSAYSGKLVRFILVTNSGLAGDLRYDWAGWAEPRLERPVWP